MEESKGVFCQPLHSAKECTLEGLSEDRALPAETPGAKATGGFCQAKARLGSTATGLL